MTYAAFAASTGVRGASADSQMAITQVLREYDSPEIRIAQELPGVRTIVVPVGGGGLIGGIGIVARATGTDGSDGGGRAVLAGGARAHPDTASAATAAKEHVRSRTLDLIELDHGLAERTTFVVTPDGQRFVVSTAADAVVTAGVGVTAVLQVTNQNPITIANNVSVTATATKSS